MIIAAKSVHYYPITLDAIDATQEIFEMQKQAVASLEIAQVAVDSALGTTLCMNAKVLFCHGFEFQFLLINLSVLLTVYSKNLKN